VRYSTYSCWLTGALTILGCSSDDPPGPSSNDIDNGFLVGDNNLPGAEGEGGPAAGPQCLGETHQAEAIGLDIYVMLDISGSMLDLLPEFDPTAGATTKWDAVRTSLETFVQAPETAGIGIGLQYFPLNNEGVPSSCSTNDECGPGGPCTNSICVTGGLLNVEGDGVPAFEFTRVAGDSPRFCTSDGECPGAGETCQSLIGECVFPPGAIPQNPEGAFVNVADDPATSLVSPLCGEQADCDGLPETACEEVGVCTLQLIKCSVSIGCPEGAGECAPFPYSCLNQTTCDVARYAAPALPISSAEARATDVVASLSQQVPQGQTPTGPALTGALEHARLWAAQNPNRQVVTVLATDGFPTSCEPIDTLGISEVAASANDGDRPVRTFVIGVFGNADLGGDGQQRLDSIARAGGTDRAILVNTAGNVAQDFLDALETIRNTAVSCEFRLDTASDLNFDQVNMQMTDASGTSTELFNVGDVSACGADAPGWYYVRDASGTPYQINVCPGTCAAFMGEGVRADLQIGCATRIR
jgi:hypothetical protein